jgi:hypothetical protein
VPDEDLVALNNAANLFLDLSIFEGFGLPPLEAIVFGTPVITSNTSSLLRSHRRHRPDDRSAGDRGTSQRASCYSLFRLHLSTILATNVQAMQLAQHPPITLSPTIEEGFLKQVCGTVPGELLDVALAIKSKATTFVIISQ